MTVMTRRTLTLLLAICLFATCFAFADTTFTDGTFAGWTATQTQDGSTGSATATQFLSGGDPGAYLQITNNTGDSGSFWGVALNPTAVYDPGSGAILSLGMSGMYSTISVDSLYNGQCTGLALSQGGTIYVGSYLGPALECGYYDKWHNVSFSSLDSSDFSSSTGTHPDFSTSGSQITFGLTAFNLGAGRSTDTDFDNFSVTVQVAGSTEVPEPSSLLLLASGALGLLGVIRRKLMA